MTVPFDVEAAFATFDEPVSIFSSEGVYVYINPAGEKLLGIPASDLLGRTYLQVFPDLATHAYHHAFVRVASGGSEERLEFHYAATDRWSSQRLYATRGHVIVIWQDITERKRAEHALEDSLAKVAETQRQFRLMIEWMPQLAWWAKPDGFIDYYNPRWYAYTGTTEADMEGWGWQSVHDPALLPSVLARWQDSIAMGAPFEMEFPLRRHDGVFRWFLTRVAPLRDEQGEIVRWVGINTDIDDQKRALAQVDETLESMNDAFFLLDREWNMVRVNRNQEKVSSTPRAESLGRQFWELFPSAAVPTSKYWIEYHRVMEERVTSHFEEFYAPFDLWTEVDAFPSPEGGIAVFFRDISERKRSELQRAQLFAREQEARATAETANRSKDEFLAMLGHELRNPLAPIVTALELMRLREPTTAQRERTVIERQVTHLVRLVDDLLDVSRITSGKVELSITRFDVAALLARAIDTASPIVEERKHRVAIDVTPGLVVDADVQRLEQVLTNLLANAAKYTPPGGLITVGAERTSDMIVMRVSDNGVGITPDLLPHVFELFVQGRQSIDRAQGGLGLGLAIVQRLVELHRGHVTAESAGVGYGSVFSVYLPFVEPTAGAPVAPIGLPTRSPHPVNRRILVVDDNEDAAELLAEMLQTMGYATRTAHDGPSALRVLESFTPDVAILDIGLPVMDGYELARLIRDRGNLARLKLFALTGYGQASDRERTAAAGFDEHLVKPVDIARLAALLEKRLE
jgi:PAS domain S-box-containing protein